MHIAFRAAAAAAALLACGEVFAVANQLYADGQVVNSGWIRRPGDPFSGTVFLRGSTALCSGTLISPTAVLTAAHCKNAMGMAYFIEDTANNYLGSFVGIPVISFIPYPTYAESPGADRDLAIAILRSPAPAWARISKLWTSNDNRPYSGTVFMAGYGRTRDQSTGQPRNTPTISMQGMMDGTSWTTTMPQLNVGSARIAQPSTATAAALVGKTDYDRWYPDRAGMLLKNSLGRDDDGGVWDYDLQKSPYGFTQRLVNGVRTFTGGGPIWYPFPIESVTLPGDSGSSVFYNPRKLVETILWITSYDDMVALGGVPNDALLAFLKTAYQDDTNYIVGVTSQVWVPGSACAEGDTNCFVNNALASNGGANYTMVRPYIGWINSVLGANGSALATASAAMGGDSGANYVEFATMSSDLPPVDVEVNPQSLSGLPSLSTFSLGTSSLAGCKSTTAKITLGAAAPSTGISATLLDMIDATTIPASMTVPAGALTKSVTIKTKPVTTAQTGRVNVTFGGTTLSRDLTVRPMGVLSLAVTEPVAVIFGGSGVTSWNGSAIRNAGLDATGETEASAVDAVSTGGFTMLATAKLECVAAPGPITVQLTSSNPAVASLVSSSVVVPQAVQTAQPIQIVTQPVLAKTTVDITATANGISRTTKLTLNPAASVSPTSLKFGSAAAGTQTAAQFVTIYNKGPSTISITGINITGTYASWFPRNGGTCGASLSLGNSCTVGVAFKPVAAAAHSAKLNIATSATSLPIGVSLSGTGT